MATNPNNRTTPEADQLDPEQLAAVDALAALTADQVDQLSQLTDEEREQLAQLVLAQLDQLMPAEPEADPTPDAEAYSQEQVAIQAAVASRQQGS